MPIMVPAVDAVDTLRVLSGWFVLLGELRLCVYPSAGTISMHLPSDYIYPYRCRRELLATAHPDAGSVAITAP